MAAEMNIPGSDIKVLEHSTLKVPYEVLNKKFRTAQKVLDREAAYVAQAECEVEKLLSEVPFITISPTTSVSSISQTTGLADSTITDTELTYKSDEPLEECDGAAGESDKSESDAAISESAKVVRGPRGREVSKLLGVLVERLTSLKRKAGESIAEELGAARAVRKRVQHLKTYSVGGENQKSPLKITNSEPAWKRCRLNRMLVDHLLREGMYDTALLLSESLGIRELTNVDVFAAAKEVEESLKRHETNRMVAWCYENKSKLRKIRSTLELEIRVQEFVELIRIGKRSDAVKHARKYLADADDPDHAIAEIKVKKLQKCMGLLAFPTSTTLHPYADLLSPERWMLLITHFRQEHARLYQLSPISVLGAVVQAGLASLKTPQCYRSTTKNTNCPVCSEPLSTLARDLPYAHCAHSQLICAISGEPLNENNPPLVLPSGFVYGTRSLQEMAKNNGGKVICSRTSRVFNFSEAEKVYVM